MPTPVSVTDRLVIALAGSGWVGVAMDSANSISPTSMVSVPPLGIASPALTTRLTMTCSI